jgi:hypothetical protein
MGPFFTFVDPLSLFALVDPLRIDTLSARLFFTIVGNLIMVANHYPSLRPGAILIFRRKSIHENNLIHIPFYSQIVNFIQHWLATGTSSSIFFLRICLQFGRHFYKFSRKSTLKK